MIDFISLELIQFHDIPIKYIGVQNTPSAVLNIEIMLWKEDIKDYIINRLVFGQLIHLKPEAISFNNQSELEISSFDYHLKGELFYGKMMCLTGFGKPSLEIEFSCKRVEVENLSNSVQ